MPSIPLTRYEHRPVPAERHCSGLDTNSCYYVITIIILFAQHAEMNSKICNVPDRKCNSFSSNSYSIQLNEAYMI